MAAAFRILLWAVVLLAPGGVLLAPVLAAYELRRRNQAAAKPDAAPSAAVKPAVAGANAELSSSQLAA